MSHFQKLFDVTSLRGVYPRMNEVYTKLGEMTNAMRNLRDILDLGDLHRVPSYGCYLCSMTVWASISISWTHFPLFGLKP